ncbi:MAG TPA: hypothetical protein VKB00_02645 [Candidatus Limnocylindrales bacterium]|nr:hypothetical protein [Candidatus Limnocylindrales bacterium]
MPFAQMPRVVAEVIDALARLEQLESKNLSGHVAGRRKRGTR